MSSAEASSTEGAGGSSALRMVIGLIVLALCCVALFAIYFKNGMGSSHAGVEAARIKLDADMRIAAEVGAPVRVVGSVKSSAAPENGLDGTNFEFDIKGFAGTAHVTAAMFRLPPEEPVEEKPANKPAAGNSGMRPFQDNTAAANTEKKEDSEADKKDEESNAADESADKEGDASESDEAKASDAAEPQAEEKQEYVIAESEKKDKLPMPTWAAKAIQVTFPNGEVYDLTIKAIEKRASMAR